MEPRQIYDALVTFDIAGEKIEPQLAASWNRINDTTIEFKLRDHIPSAFTKSIATLPTAYDRSIHLWKEGRKGSLATACILGPSLFGEGRLRPSPARYAPGSVVADLRDVPNQS